MLTRIITIVSIVIFSLFALAPVTAGETQFTVKMRANYDFNILGGTPLNSGPDTGFLPFAAIGDVTFELDPSINDPSANTVPFVDFTGELHGIAPSPPNLLPHLITPSVAFFGGNLTNIVRDAMTGEVISADVDDLQAQWKMVGLPGSDIDGLELPTGGNAFDPDSNLPFFGSVNAVPFALGDVIVGPDIRTPNLGDEEFEVFLPGFPTPVVLGRARTLTVIVPEPASLSWLGWLGVGIMIRVRCRV